MLDRTVSADHHQRRRDVIVVCVIIAVAFLLRFVHLLEARSVVFFQLLVSDGKAYTEWADRIIGGDWLGSGVFYQAPLYPYFLAVVKLVVGNDLFWIRFVQIVLGALSCGMLVAAGRHFFGRPAGALAGVMLALYPTAIFFDVLIQKTVLASFWMTMLLWALARAQRRPTLLGCGWIGATLAALILTRENALLFVLVIGVWTMLGQRSAPIGRRAARLGTFIAGAAIVLLPVGFRNLAVGGQFELTTSQAGPNFYIGNNPNADGSYRPLRPGRSDTPQERVDARELAEQAVGHSLSPREVSEYWFDKAFSFMREQPRRWLALLIRKFRMVLNAYEIPDAEDIYYYAQRCAMLRALDHVFHFGVLCPLGLAGIIATAGSWRRTWVLHALLITIIAGVVAFYVFSRYRFPMVPILVLFAAAGLVELPRMIRGRAWVRLAISAAVLAGSAVFVNWPMFDRKCHLAVTYSNAGAALADAGRFEEAIEQDRIAVRLSPGTAEAYFNLGEALRRIGDTPSAVEAFRAASVLEPNDPEIPYKYGNALAALGQFDAAVAQYQASLALKPDDVGVLNNLGACLLQLRRYREAIETFKRALAIKPDEAGTAGNLAWLLATCEDRSLRDPAEAVRLAERACELTAQKDANQLDTLATAYAAAGRFADAARTARVALERARATNNAQLAEQLQRKIAAYDARR